MKKYRVLVIVVLVAIAAAPIFWKVRHRTAEAAKARPGSLTSLSAEDIVSMLQHQSIAEPSKVYSIVETAQTRKIFLNGLKDYLGLAARARSEGLADEPNIKLSLEYKRNYLLGTLYKYKLDQEQKQPYEISNEQIESFWKDQQYEKQFETEVRALRAIQESVAENSGNPHAAPELQGEALEKTRKEWAKTKILSNLAKADAEFMNQRVIELRLQIAEAGVLAFNYVSKHWAEKVVPSKDEIQAYLTAHPEYDIRKKREKAEMVLLRARAGEDFTKLAREFSEDRATKDKGGLYEDLVKGMLWPEVETVALGLNKGEIAPRIVESLHGYHVVQLVDTKTEKDEGGSDIIRFKVRHILLRKAFEEPGASLKPDTPPPFREPKEIAAIVVQNEKRRKFIDEICSAEHISLPEDFPFEVTAELKIAAMSAAQQVRELINKDDANRNNAKSNDGTSSSK